MTKINNKVIWQQGMFLQPQHFQQHDRYWEHFVQQQQRACGQYTWGFSELSLDVDLLHDRKVGIISASGIFPDGTPFQIPCSDMLPSPLAVSADMSGRILYLTLAHRHERSQVGDAQCQQPYRYQVEPTTVADYIADQQHSADIQVGSLACRLRHDGEDLQSNTVLPIARIAELTADQRIELDHQFMMPCIDIGVLPRLINFTGEVHRLLKNRAFVLANRLADSQQAGTVGVEELMVLQMVNKYQALLHYLLQRQPLHPENLYVVLIQLLAEMATLTRQSRHIVDLPGYQHDDLSHSFDILIDELRQALSTVLEQNAVHIKLQSRSSHTWVGQIHDKSLLTCSRFILVVCADCLPEKISQQFPAQVKIGPVEKIRQLVSHALPGIDCRTVVAVPKQIPYHANYTYFELDQQHELWPEMADSGGIAVQINGDYPGLKLDLWSIKETAQ